MELLLDSDIVIDYFNGQKYALSLLNNSDKYQYFLSIISWIEIQYGFEKFNSDKKKLLLDEFIRSFKLQIIPLDVEIARKYLLIKINLEKKKIPLADFDLLIAATALNHSLGLVTRTKRHFSRIPELKIYF